jgi:hypothetical protein
MQAIQIKWRCALRYNPSRFVGVVLAAALSLSTASAAQIFFTGTGTGDVVYSAWNIPGGIFGFFYDYYDVTSCSGGSCFAASTPDGTPLGNFGLSIAPNYFLSNVGNGELVTLVDTSVYYEELVPYPAGAAGTISMSNANIGGPYLLEGDVTGIGVYAIPGTTSAAFQFDITNATSQAISGLPSTVYLDIYGSATTAVTTSTFNGSDTVFNGFTLDWTATLTDTSALSLTGTVSSAPEPSSLFLVLGGAVYFARRLHSYRRQSHPPIIFRDPIDNRVQI